MKTIALTAAYIIVSGSFLLPPMASILAAEPKRMYIPQLGSLVPTNAIVHADFNHPQDCPVSLTNLLSNTNLLSPTEQEIIITAALRFKNVSSNTPPAGATFSGWSWRRFTDKKSPLGTNPFVVACYRSADTNITDEISFMGNRMIHVQHRNNSSDKGFNALIIDRVLLTFVEYNGSKNDGIMVSLDQEKAETFLRLGGYARFANGLIYGKSLAWGRRSVKSANGYQLVSHVDFLSPFDFSLHAENWASFAWEVSDPP